MAAPQVSNHNLYILPERTTYWLTSTFTQAVMLKGIQWICLKGLSTAKGVTFIATADAIARIIESAFQDAKVGSVFIDSKDLPRPYQLAQHVGAWILAVPATTVFLGCLGLQFRWRDLLILGLLSPVTQCLAFRTIKLETETQ